MKKIKSKILFAAIVILVTIGVTFPNSISSENFFKQQIFDLWAKWSPQDYDPKGIYSFEFDQSSLLEMGYPIDRQTHAVLLRKLLKYEPKVVAYDIIFGQSKDKSGTLQFSQSITQAKIPVVLAASVNEDFGIDGPELPIDSSKISLGVVDGHLDTDGTYRWFSLVHSTGDGYLPSLALQIYLLKHGYQFKVDEDKDSKINGIQILKDDFEVQFLDLRSDPFKMGRMSLRPRLQSSDLKYFSWSETLSHDFVPRVNLKDAVFLIGLTASGVAGHQSTSVDPTQKPLHNHLFILQDLEESTFLKPWKWEVYFLVIWVIAVLLIFIIRKPLSYFANVTSVIGCTLILFTLSFFLWNIDFFWVPQSELISLFLAGFFAFIRRSSDEERQKAVLKKSFSSYLHPSLVKELMEQATEVKLGGEEREITLLFSDLRNFTTLSEKVSSTELVSIMNEYFTIATQHIQESGGTVDKFIGDAVMAFWNAPLPQVAHAENSLKAVLKIREDFKIFSSKWENKLNLQSAIELGIGLHTGNAIVGNIGGNNRFNYTALGDNVNLASRLEGICKVYGVDIIVSGTLINHIREEHRGPWIEIDQIQVKGQSKDVTIYTENTLTAEENHHWQKMLKAWRFGQAEEAQFQLDQIPHDFGPAETFRQRLKNFKTFPTDWKGIWKMQEK